MSDFKWPNVTAQNPCQICGGKTWCRVSPSGGVFDCYRDTSGTGLEKKDSLGQTYHRHYAKDFVPSAPRKAQPVITPVVTVDRAPEEVLTGAYGYIFSQGNLGPYHTRTMVERGWLEPILRARQYISAPNYNLREKIVQELFARYGDVAKQIPGVISVKDKDGKEVWTLASDEKAIWIPVRNVQGKIVRVKIRFDDSTSKNRKAASRYVWLSSSKYGGASSGVAVHVPLWRKNKNAPFTCDTVRITEGERKADYATSATGVLTISVPGVSSWNLALPVLEKLQAKTVKVAFDADARENRFVARALRELVKALNGKYALEVETWDPSCKGIDDALVARAEIRTDAGEEALKRVDEICDAADAAASVGQKNDPLPTLPAFAREKLAAVLSVFTKAWIDNPDSATSIAQAIAAVLGQAGIESGLVGALVAEIALASSERRPDSFGFSARNCAEANLKTPMPGVWNTAARAGIKEALRTLRDQLVAEYKPDPFNIKGLIEYLDKYDPETGRPIKDPNLPPAKPFEPRTNKPWVTMNGEDLSKSFRRRLTGFEVDSFNEEDIKRKTLLGFFECNTISRWLNHDKCDRSEFAGIKRCQCVACFTCRAQIAFLAKEYVRSRNYGNWPDRIVVFETLLNMEPQERFPSRNNVNSNLAIRNAALRNLGFLDDAPRTVVETDRMRTFMAVDPLKSEAQHVADLQKMAQANVRVLDRDAAIEIYYNSLLVIPKAIDRLFEDEDINGYFDPDDEERQIAADSMRSIIATVNQTLGRRFVLGGRSKLTLQSGLASAQQALTRRKYNFEEEQLDPNILNPKMIKEEVVFDDGCKCGSTSYIDVHFATEHLRIPGLQDDDESFVKAARYAWDSGETQTSLREYCTPGNMALDDPGHLERLPKTQRVWAPPEAELASV